MQSQLAWASGFLSQIILRYLRKEYPVQAEKIDPRSFFSVIEGSEFLKDPGALLNDRHAYFPEEVLRELLHEAERISGGKDIAYRAAISYFSDSGRQGQAQPPSLFEVIAGILDDVRAVALFSNQWATVYTTFLKLQAIMADPAKNEVIILSQSIDGFSPILSMHHMLRGNYEGFVRLYDHVQEATFEEEFLQYRISDIVNEFQGYSVEWENPVRIVDVRRRKTVVEFERVTLDQEEIPVFLHPMLTSTGSSSKHGISDEGLILPPQAGRDRLVYSVLNGKNVSTASTHTEGKPQALRVLREGVIKSGSLKFVFQEGKLFDTPYSRYRFHWKESPRPHQDKTVSDRGAQRFSRFLFDSLQDLKASQQRLLAYAVENKALTAENLYLREEVNEEWSSKVLLGESPKMKSVVNMVRQIAPTDSSILITGETGTGKELIARLIHAESFRRSERFVAMNCGAIPEGLLESELFGHEKGAFSGATTRRLGRFELAHEGTLFLDEIGDVSPSMQVRLLRVLQEQTFERVGGEKTIQVDVRVIAATNQNLHDLVLKGQFRKDLYYRLNVIPIELPLLRDRVEDISLLSEHFIKKHAAKLKKKARRLSPEVLVTLKGYNWPGNVRELENIMERMTTLCSPNDLTLSVNLLPSELQATTTVPSRDLAVENWLDEMNWNNVIETVSSDGSMDSFLKKVEWSVAKRAIRVYGNKSQAARALKRTYRWIRKLEKQMDTTPSE